jgi:hypothetical protein
MITTVTIVIEDQLSTHLSNFEFGIGRSHFGQRSTGR